MNEFQEKIDLLSNSELLKVIRAKEDYQIEFWQMAIENAKKRGLENEIKDITLEIQKKKIENEIVQKQKIEKESSLIELYSDRAIITFSILFTTIAGSILFSYNLKKLGKEGSDTILAFGFIYTIGILIMMYALPFQSLNSIGFLLNILGGL